MTDINSQASPNLLSADQVAGTLDMAKSISPEFHARAVEMLRKDGYTIPDATAAPTGGPMVRQEPVAITAPKGAVGPLELSVEQAGQMARELLAHGADPTRVHAALAADGVKLLDDPRSTEEKEFDGAFHRAAPNEYKINWHGRAPAGISTSELADLNREVSVALHEMSFPAELGTSLAEMAYDDAAEYSRLSKVDQVAWDRQQRLDLARAVGDDKLELAISNARILLSFVRDKDPAIFAKLTSGGAFRSARVAAQLHMQAERMFARHDMFERRGKV